ncbi:uncharacterized protein GBIM_11675 [Gryllus bimaculatus]|nr:uncharacterized protein GBIM_11675 [Gryllus bimaculatus]
MQEENNCIRPPRRFKKSKVNVIEKAKREVEELAKVVCDNGESLPYGHLKWARAKQEERVPVAKEKLARHSRGTGLSEAVTNTKLLTKEHEIEYAIEQAARTEILLTEDAGFLEVDEGESSTQVTQKQIANSVDILSASKHFQLFLEEFGPYRINYTRNGRYLLLGGRKGHIAAFDWITKKPLCEINVMEELFDVQWLHNELMFAVAQKRWMYIYDNQGVELHCLKTLHNVLRMDFLPYHFLLACSSANSFLSWLDVSLGKMVAQFPIRQGRLNIMAQNPYNACLCLGHAQGTVTMWSPNMKEPLVKMLCHNRPLQALAVNRNGMYMATSAVDRSVRIWDLRQLNGPLQDYRMAGIASNLSFSDRSLLAVGMGNIVEVYRDCCATTADQAYLRHKVNRSIADMQFCPYEDILGVGSGSGFTSMIVPGAGEPNFDALESNPYQTKRQRQEAEVKALLEKIQPELITLDPYAIGEVNVPTLKEKMAAKHALMLGKPPQIDFTPRRNKRKGSVRAAKAKKIVKERVKKDYIEAVKAISSEKKDNDQSNQEKPYSVLDRFLPKKKK